MYFGSVKFFKHLIIGVIILAIAVPTGISIGLSVSNKKKTDEIKSLQAQVSGISTGDTAMPDTPEALFELYKNLEDKESFLKLLSEYDNELYDKFVKSFPAMNGDNTIPAEVVPSPVSTTTTTTAATTTVTTTVPEDVPLIEFTTTPPPEVSEYSDIYPELYCDTTKNVVYDEDKDCVYLTFDDGPSQYTENILYYLDQYNIKATFFVVPSGSDECNRLLRRIVDEGHTIGVHSKTHVYNDIYESVEAYLKDFKECYDIIYAATGVKCELFRFPGGSINDFNEETRDEIIAEMTRRGFVYFDWNVDSNDAGGATWTEMYTNVLEQTANVNRAVILMHDHNNGYNTVLVLEDIIKALLTDERGYKFDKLTNTVRPVQF